MEERLVYEFESDLCTSKAKCIGHQFNCEPRAKGTKGKGVAAALFAKYPHSNIFHKKREPGRIYITGDNGEKGRCIVHLCAQRYMGPPNKKDDTVADRERWFKQCLDRIAMRPSLNYIALPYKIGCGLARGNWETYENMIVEWIQANPHLCVELISNEPEYDDFDTSELDESSEGSEKEWVEENVTLPLWPKDILCANVNSRTCHYVQSVENLLELHKIKFFRNTRLNYVVCDKCIERHYLTLPKEWLGIRADFLPLVPKIVEQYRDSSKPTYPGITDVLNVFNTSPNEVKVVVIGQDPYINDGQAIGYSFAVGKNNCKFPPSLANIYKKLEMEGFKVRYKRRGDLRKWVDQGVFLLNTSLTVHKQSGEHVKMWKPFTDAAIKFLTKENPDVIAILWGSHAKSYERYFKHSIVGIHPSPLSAHKGFFKERFFSKANDMLVSLGKSPIDWSLE